MFKPIKSDRPSIILLKKKSVTLDNKKCYNNDYMEMKFKPVQQKTNIIILNAHVNATNLCYQYDLQGGVLKLDINYKADYALKTGLNDLKIVLDYSDSVLKINQNTY